MVSRGLSQADTGHFSKVVPQRLRLLVAQVSGEVSLACSWRVTPLDVVTMKVKQQQAEVDHKEEILALLQEKYGIKDTTAAAPPPPPVPPMADSLIVAPSLKSFRVISDQDPDIKRIITYTGRLSVKVGSCTKKRLTAWDGRQRLDPWRRLFANT